MFGRRTSVVSCGLPERISRPVLDGLPEPATICQSLASPVETGCQLLTTQVERSMVGTHVEHACESACVTIFLAGTRRSLALGGKIGFHKGYWEAESIKEYYESEKDYYEWSNPFDMASWLYEDTQAEVFSDFEYLLERGIEPKFAIQTLRAESDGMWYPRRKELKAAGVLVE